jgi:uncharacterized protein YceK
MKLTPTFLLLCLTGCGTFTSHMRWVDVPYADRVAYGGVRLDAGVIHDVCKANPVDAMVVVPLCVLDMPLSAVADTFMLPVDLSK